MNSLKKILFSLAAASGVFSLYASDPNFHIYLCIGQSNMEGCGKIEKCDKENVPERFKVMAAQDFATPERKIGEWYTAVPPLVGQNYELSPADYFGRTMVANMPENVTVGVVPVAIGGCKIEHLSKDYDPAKVEEEPLWFKEKMVRYDNTPYARLIECAKKAQEVGVIKGILLHQGESNNGDPAWPSKVKKVYDDILSDLGLAPNSIPLLAGEVVATDMGGICGGMNRIINKLPTTLPQAKVVSSEGLPQRGDGLHFTSYSYRELGSRYAKEMLELEGVENPVLPYSKLANFTSASDSMTSPDAMTVVTISDGFHNYYCN